MDVIVYFTSILISILALFSSTVLGVYMALKSFDENFYDKKEALRSTISELMEVEEKTADLLRESIDIQYTDPKNNIAITKYFKSKGLALNNRRVALLEYAGILVEELGAAVTPAEYAVLGAVYQKSGRIDLAEKYYNNLTKSNVPYFKASAYRSLAGIDAVSNNDMSTSATSHYKSALEALKNQNDFSSVLHKASIYLEWANYDSLYCRKEEAGKNFNNARDATVSLPIMIESRAELLRQIEDSRKYLITSCSG